MANEYITLTEIKNWLGIGNTDQDTILDVIREAASRAVDDWCGRRFYLDATTSVRYYTATEPDLIFVEDIDSAAPTITLETDANSDGTFEQSWTRDDLDNYGFRLEPLNADEDARPFTTIRVLASSFPTTNRAVKVTAKHGYSATPPAPVKLATFLTAEAAWESTGRLHHTKGAPDVQSVSIEGSDSVTFETGEGAGQKVAVTEAAQGWLHPYVRYV